MLFITFGTRPELIKIQPLLKILPPEQYTLVWVKQHTDLFATEIPKIPHLITILVDDYEGCDRLNFITKSILDYATTYNMFNDADYVLVQGDTTTAFAMALAAFNKQIPIIHLEAGLRTHADEPYPEEFNRRAISMMTWMHLCPTEGNDHNISYEIPSTIYEIFVVGNTAMDNLVDIQPPDGECDIVLCTMHRRENHANMNKWFDSIESLAKDNPKLHFVLPLHPNPNVTKHQHILKSVDVLEPVSHEACLELMRYSKVVITDSGGIQEEASWLQKPCIVCRKYTERPESMGAGGAYLCQFPKELKGIFKRALKRKRISSKKVFGKGDASAKIKEIFEGYNVIRNDSDEDLPPRFRSG